jgi:uncharacterized protein
MNWLSPTKSGTILSVRLTPRASRDEVTGVVEGALRIRLQAPPVDGKANKALLRFLADLLDLPPSSLAILSGDTGRNKRILIPSLTEEQVREKLGVKQG